MTEDELAANDPSYARLLEKKKRLEAQIKKKRGQLRDAARKADSHAKIVLGGMLLNELGIAWNEINFEEVAMRMPAAASALGDVSCEPLELENAKKRLSAWETKGKHWGDFVEPTVEKKNDEVDWNADGQAVSVPAFDFVDASDDSIPWH